MKKLVMIGIKRKGENNLTFKTEMDNNRYCGDCINIVGTPIGSYCKIDGKNLDKQRYYSHNKDDTELLQHCNGRKRK